MGKIAFVGDIHGFVEHLEKVNQQLFDEGIVEVMIQVGDLGIYPNIMPVLKQMEFPLPIYFIDGNHEAFNLLFGMIDKDNDVTEIVPNLFYVKRGSILTLADKKIAFIGGAASVDKAWRTSGYDWFPEEIPTDEDFAKLNGVTDIDYFVSHTAPQSIIERNFPAENLVRYWNLPRSWKDSTAVRLEETWKNMGRPEMFCGHMHCHIEDSGCTILNINEVLIK